MKDRASSLMTTKKITNQCAGFYKKKARFPRERGSGICIDTFPETALFPATTMNKKK